MITILSDNKRAQRARRCRSLTAILRLVRGLTSTRARSGIPRRSGNCHRLFAALDAATNSYTANALNQYSAITDPGNTVNPVYDLDGNIITNGVWSFRWDAENRLKAVYSNDTLLVVNAYDDQSRRIKKVTAQGTRTFLYDGWNVLRETAGASTNYFLWGLDLSGTMQGAGGVGGLLAVYTVNAGTTSTYYPCYDANGNITAYVDESGIVKAKYVYDAFGNTISQSGDMDSIFSYRFSTKYADDETGLYYYGYRYYAPGLGRWVNRDPIEEADGPGVYLFLKNDGVAKWDKLGLAGLSRTIEVPKCNIALFIGHQYVYKRSITWKFPDPNICAFGGDIGCMPALNLPKNDKARWPNQVNHLEEIFPLNNAVAFDKRNRTMEVYANMGPDGDDQKQNNKIILDRMYSIDSFKLMYDALYSKPCCCREVVVTIIIGEEIEGDSNSISDLISKYKNWTPGHTKKYKVSLVNRFDLVGEYEPKQPHFQ